jgi:Zn-dependent peptidase ImmA (M78 family)
VTIVAGSKVVVILNSAHSLGRQASDLAHELAHRIREHKAQKIEMTGEGIMLLKSYDKLQEEEADWLSACLLLPREALAHIKRAGMATDKAALEYGVSASMLNYRLSTSGVNRQFSYQGR